jgi:mannose-6-phosphate isomerase-like protein (cupin superfamily)
MQRDGKVWGSTSLLWRTPLIEVHKLEIVAGGYCSWHKHQHKHNAFIVHSGALTIEIKKAAYPLTDKTVLRAGDFTTVRPGEEHRFVAGLSPTVAFEIYYPEMLSEDIVRTDVGGIDEALANVPLMHHSV